MPRIVTNLNGIGNTYNANDVIGKTLIANIPVNVYPSASNTVPLYTVNTGNTVGVVYSWVNKNGVIWWQMEPGNKFVSHAQGKFNMQVLTDQGLLTTAEKEEAKKDANKSWLQKFLEGTSKKVLTGAALITVGYIVFKQVTKNK
jgi:hypothetical protein